MLFSGSLESGHTLVWALWNNLRLPSVGFACQEEKISCFKVTVSPQDSLYHGQKEGYMTTG